MAIYNKSLWDYLGEAGTAGVGSFFQAKQMAEENKLRAAAEARAQADFQMRQEPFQLGQQIRASESNPVPVMGVAGQGMPMGGMTVPKKSFSESQYDFAGIKSPRVRGQQAKAEGLQTLAAQTQIDKNQQDITLGNERLQPAAVAGRRLDDLSKHIELYGTGAADESINTLGGWKALVVGTKIGGKHVTAEQAMQTMGKKAFDTFIGRSKLGDLNPTESEFVRSRIQSHLLDRQLKALDIDAQMKAAQFRSSYGQRDPMNVNMDNISANQGRLIQMQALVDKDEAGIEDSQKMMIKNAVPPNATPEQVSKDFPNLFNDWSRLKMNDERKLEIQRQMVRMQQAQVENLRTKGQGDISSFFAPPDGGGTGQAQPGQVQPSQSIPSQPAPAASPSFDWRKLITPSRP